MNWTPRRLFITLVAAGFVIFNPVHLPWSLPWLAARQEGTSLGLFLTDNEGPIVIASTVYFTVVMVPVYYWLWTRRRRRTQNTAAPVRDSRESGRVQEEAYKGPGGGKRLPSSTRRRQRRRR